MDTQTQLDEEVKRLANSPMGGYRLVDLDGHLVKRTGEREEAWDVPLAEAEGVIFQCPLCVNTGGHYVQCWFAGKVPDGLTPGPGRWTPTGTGIDDLTLNPSVHLSGEGCGWHGWVKNGEAA
jgi:hypothetical protein